MITDFKIQRLLTGLTQFELMIKTNIQQSKISHCERGLLQLSNNEKKKIEEALGKKIKWQKKDKQ
jgi:ribosome-binding protein aMBF1 (putative translation factor)